MTALALTYPTVTDGVTVVAAAIHNANFPQIQTAVNSIDRTNMGAAGIDATSLIPTTNAAATFGGITAGVGYKFLASAATSVPLTVSAIAGQSVDIFDVTLTSGGTKSQFVDSAGRFNSYVVQLITAGAAGAAGSHYMGIGNPDGFNFNIPSATTNGWRFLVNNASIVANLTPAGNLTVNALATVGITPVASNVLGGNVAATAAAAFTTPIGAGGNIFASGDTASQRGVSTGEHWIGGSTTSYSWDGGINSAGNMSFCKSGAPLGNFNGTTGVYTATSDAKFKDNVAAIANAQAAIMALKPSGFTWKASGANDFGFIAQEVQAIFPDAVIVLNDERVKDGEDPILGINYQVIVAQLVAAFQSYVAAHP